MGSCCVTQRVQPGALWQPRWWDSVGSGREAQKGEACVHLMADSDCSVQFSSVQSLSRVWLFATFSRSVVSDSLWPHESQHTGFPVHHQLPDFTQTHAHRVGDAIQPSHPLSSPSPPAPNPSQHQDLFQWVSSSYEVAKVLEFQLQHQSFQWTPRTDLL